MGFLRVLTFASSDVDNSGLAEFGPRVFWRGSEREGALVKYSAVPWYKGLAVVLPQPTMPLMNCARLGFGLVDPSG